jgi:hypothetical protein
VKKNYAGPTYASQHNKGKQMEPFYGYGNVRKNISMSYTARLSWDALSEKIAEN